MHGDLFLTKWKCVIFPDLNCDQLNSFQYCVNHFPTGSHISSWSNFLRDFCFVYHCATCQNWRVSSKCQVGNNRGYVYCKCWHIHSLVHVPIGTINKLYLSGAASTHKWRTTIISQVSEVILGVQSWKSPKETAWRLTASPIWMSHEHSTNTRRNDDGFQRRWVAPKLDAPDDSPSSIAGTVPPLYREVFDVCSHNGEPVHRDVYQCLLSQCNLSTGQLKVIWDLAGPSQGLITRTNLYKTLALVAWAQQGKTLSEKLFNSSAGKGEFFLRVLSQSDWSYCRISDAKYWWFNSSQKSSFAT
jgi:hypothetical protein